VVLASSAARAQAPAAPPLRAAAPTDAPSTDATAVDAADDVGHSIDLFREGRRLLAQGLGDEACAKFRASLALRRSPGTLLNIGKCLESSGDLTGAVAVLEETLARARTEADTRKAEVWSGAARAALDALTPRVPRLVLAAPTEPDARVALDGQAFSAFGTEEPLNPGPHVLVATAPDEPRIEHRFELVERQVLVLSLSALVPAQVALGEAEPAPIAPVASERHELGHDDSRSGSRLLAWSILGVGGAVLIAGGVTGAIAVGKTSDLERECPERQCPGDLSAPESAHRTAVIADVLMGVGLVGVAVGATWLLWPQDDTAPSLSAGCDGRGCGMSVQARFF
jgi:hypothetical protein